MTQRVDAAIVGGGPAGAILARRLALKSWRVMLIERGARFRPKTCGHCLAPRALSILKDEGLLPLAQGLAVGFTRGLRVHAGQRRCVTATLGESEDDAGLLVRRDQFDQALRDAAAEAGAIVAQPASARLVEIGSAAATLRMTTATQTVDVRCGLVIGADGLGSAVARAAGLVDRHAAGRKYGFSLTVPFDGASAGLHQGSIEMFLLRCGYIGAVLQADGHVHFAALVNAADRDGCASPAETMKIAAASHLTFSQLQRQTSISELSSRAIAAGPMPWRTRAVASGRIALAGDAAGYIEPFTGEGMTWAIESARLLARSIECSGGAWNRAAAEMYACMWNERIAGAQRMCRWISAGLERPMLSRMLHRVAARVPALAEQLVRRAVAA